MLSHLSHPHSDPSIPAIQLKKATNLSGALIMSPWTSFSTSSASYRANANKDLLAPPVLATWSSEYLGRGVAADRYNQAVTAETGWWTDLKVDAVLVTAGEDEVFIDDVRVVADRMEKASIDGNGITKVTTVFVDGDAHDQPLMDLLLGYKQPGLAALRIRAWIAARL